MRVAVYYSNRDIRIEQQDRPTIGPGELLMKVIACGICGSDVMEWYRKDKVPLVLGHEVAGEIVQVGEGVCNFSVGDRICASHHVPCLTCHYCRRGNETVCDTLRSTNFDPGGFSEYLRLPSINVDLGTYPLYDNVSYHQAAFIEPLACVIRGQRRAKMTPGMSVLVIGSGISGLLHIALAKASGAGRIFATDISPFRVEQALQFGADHAWQAKQFSPEKLKEKNFGFLADLVIMTTGNLSAIDQGMNCLDRGGTLLLFAPTDAGEKYELDINKVFWKNDTTFVTTYAGSPSDHYLAMELLSANRVPVKKMITHVLPLEKTVDGFGLVAAGTESIKVIIEPNA